MELAQNLDRRTFWVGAEHARLAHNDGAINYARRERQRCVVTLHAYDQEDSVIVERYRVAQVSGIDGNPAPPEIAERFQGRAWTKHELEQRGVRITGAVAWYLATGKDWQLTLEPI